MSNSNNNTEEANGNYDPDPATAAAIAAALSEPPITRSTRSSKRPTAAAASLTSTCTVVEEPEPKRAKSNTNNNVEHTGEPRRPKAQECLEDYVEFAANLMLPSPGPGAPPYHSLPTMSALRFLKHPQRRRTVWEDWSPYQISLFEAGMAHYGKDFYAIAKEFQGSKSTKQIVDFYYLWKKTSHYKKWKKTYLPAHLDVSDDDEREPGLTGKDGAPNNGKGK